jgi:lipopolysaccharide export LptBFGC system permease protein LptF
MKTLHLYLTRQMLATLGMTVFVFTCVLLLGNVLKEILHLLLNRQATLGLAIHAILLLIPYVLAYSLPIGMLTAALLVFGRFSADQELTAARASGVSLVSLVSPVLLLSVAVSAVCAWLNFDVAPACRTEYRKLILSAGENDPAKILQSDQAVQVGDYTVFIGKKNGTNLENVIVTKGAHNGKVEEYIQGPTGEMATDTVKKQIVLTIHSDGGWSMTTNGWMPTLARGDFPLIIDLQAQKDVFTIPPSDMSFFQLREELRKLEQPFDFPQTHPMSESAAKREQEVKRMVKDMTTPLLVYMNREVAFSFACIGFTLVGIPLAIRAHRRETSIGVAVALVLMLIYYSFIVLAQAWENHPERGPCVIVWIPNFIFQVVGAVLLWKANRGV